MDIEVVRREVCDNRHVGALAHGNKLETRELDNRIVVRVYALDFGQQGLADVASEVNGLSRRLQELGNDRRCGGLAVGACDGNCLARTQLKENLHLRGQYISALAHSHKLGLVERCARAAENYVRVDIVKVAISQNQLSAVLLCEHAVFAEGFKVLSVERLDLCSLIREQLYQRQVACADADEGYGLALDSFKKTVYRSIHKNPSLVKLSYLFIILINGENFNRYCNIPLWVVQ